MDMIQQYQMSVYVCLLFDLFRILLPLCRFKKTLSLLKALWCFGLMAATALLSAYLRS